MLQLVTYTGLLGPSLHKLNPVHNLKRKEGNKEDGCTERHPGWDGGDLLFLFPFSPSSSLFLGFVYSWKINRIHYNLQSYKVESIYKYVYIYWFICSYFDLSMNVSFFRFYIIRYVIVNLKIKEGSMDLSIIVLSSWTLRVLYTSQVILGFVEI